MSALFQPFPMLAGRRAQAWRHQPAYRRPRHFHAEPEINLVVRGTCVLGIGDRTVVLSEGRLVLLQPGQDHELIEASNDFDLFVLALRPELAERALGPRALRSLDGTLLGSDELASVVAELSGLGDVSDAAGTELRLAELFALAIARTPPAHVVSRRTLDCVQSERELSETALAERIGQAPSGISRRFHGDLGVTLVEYRSRLRLIRFVELVDRGESLSRAALDADFGSYAQCHRVFRRALGCTPRDYFRGARDAVDHAVHPR